MSRDAALAVGYCSCFQYHTDAHSGCGRLTQAVSGLQVYLLNAPTMVGPSLRLNVVGEHGEIADLLKFMAKQQVGYRVLASTRLRVTSGNAVDSLTVQQRRILRLAHTLGYYDVPRKISTDGLTRRLGSIRGLRGSTSDVRRGRSWAIY